MVLQMFLAARVVKAAEHLCHSLNFIREVGSWMSEGMMPGISSWAVLLVLKAAPCSYLFMGLFVEPANERLPSTCVMTPILGEVSS